MLQFWPDLKLPPENRHAMLHASYARKGFVSLYNDVKSLRKLYETRPSQEWSGTQTFQCGHWTESSTVDPWILFAVDPFDVYKTKKDYRTSLKDDLVWSDVQKQHEKTFCTLQCVSDNTSSLTDVLKDPCFEYAKLPDLKSFWMSNKPPKVYPENVLGHALPYIFVPETRIEGLEGLVWVTPSEALVTLPSLGYVFRRRPSYRAQLWSFHVTVTSRNTPSQTPTLSPSACFEMNDASYWIKNQHDQKLLFNPCVPRDPVILEPGLKAMLNGFTDEVPHVIVIDEDLSSDSTDISLEESSAEAPEVSVKPEVHEPAIKAPKIRFVFKDSGKVLSKTLRDHCFETLWEFK